MKDKEFSAIVVNLAEHAMQVVNDAYMERNEYAIDDECAALLRRSALEHARRNLPILLKAIEKGEDGAALADSFLEHMREFGQRLAADLIDADDRAMASKNIRAGTEYEDDEVFKQAFRGLIKDEILDNLDSL